MSVEIVSTVLVPIGLIAIMFSLGLSLQLSDFARILSAPKAVLLGLVGQLLLLPLLAVAIVLGLGLSPELALCLIILSACPGGVTSNAIAFAAKADIALSVTLTAFSSVVTVFSVPLIISAALAAFYPEGQAPELSILNTMKSLFIVTVLPVSLGMIGRHFLPNVAEKMVVWLRPTSMIILVGMIVFSIYISADLVVENLAKIGPAAYLLNVLAIAVGLGLAKIGSLPQQQKMTLGIEVGVQNATMAIFLTLSILESVDLSVGPTIYGAIMVFNATLLVKILNKIGTKPATNVAT